MSCVVTQDWTKVADEVFNTGLVRLFSKRQGQAASPGSCQGWAINHRGQTLWKRTKHFHLWNHWNDVFPSLFIYWYYPSFHLWWWQLIGGCESESVSSQSFLTLCNPKDYSPPSSSVHGILQAKILEGSYPLLQGTFPTQGWSPGLLYSRFCNCLSYRQVRMCFPHGLYIGSAHTFKNILKLSVSWKCLGNAGLHTAFLLITDAAASKFWSPLWCYKSVCLRTGKHGTVHHLHGTGCWSLWPDSPAGRLDTKLFKDLLSCNGVALEQLRNLHTHFLGQHLLLI